MLHIHISVVSVLGLVGLLIGLGGEPTFVMGGCVLIGASLIAKAIHYRVRE
jgi:hypothetical protein